MQKYLYDELKRYVKSGVYPFHMPGHKRAVQEFYNPYAIDITEIDGFDNLYHAEGLLKQAQDRAAALYGAEETCFLVNGSTGGILSAVSACTSRGGKLLMARNCHKSVYHSVLVNSLEAVYVYPQYIEEWGINGGISPKDVEDLLNTETGIEAVFITSPTYDGIVSDIRAISKVVHEHNIPLIVDEAHGAHFAFSEYFPKSALEEGADIVIHSLHKTLPALTQTALLHIKGTIADRDRLKRYLQIYQTSSPSYVLMASIDECIRFLSESGAASFHSFKSKLENFRDCLKELKHIKIAGEEQTGDFSAADFDRSKLLFCVKHTNMTGEALYRSLLENYKIQLEMFSENYALAITSVSDCEDGFQRLRDAVLCIDEMQGYKTGKNAQPKKILKSRAVVSISQAENYLKETVSLPEAQGRISAEFISVYPPGIPMLVPGERIGKEFLLHFDLWKRNGLPIQGMKDKKMEQIEVLRLDC